MFKKIVLFILGSLLLISYARAKALRREVVGGGATVEIGSYQVDPSDTVSVPVTASTGNSAMSAATIRVHFDPAVVQVEGCEVPSSLFGTCNIDNQQGQVSFNALSTTGVTGDFTVAEITFVAGSSGSTTLDVEIQTFADMLGNSIAVSDVDGQITITSSATPTVTPTATSPASTPTATPTQPVENTRVEIKKYKISPFSDIIVPVHAIIQANTSLGAAKIKVNFDPKVVSLTECQVAEPLFGQCTFDNQAGEVLFNALSASGTTGDFILANITFQSGASGSTTLDVEIQTFTDTSGNPIKVNDVDGQIIVNSSAQSYKIFLPVLRR